MSHKRIDTHVHFDLMQDPIMTMDEYEKNGIYSIFVTNLPELYFKYKNKIECYNYVRLAVGFHPSLCNEEKYNSDVFERALRSTSYVGEVGLDFSKCSSETKEKQIQIFENICYNSHDKILSIHSRKSSLKCLEILKKHEIRKAIFHWYTDPVENISQLIASGYYFSINKRMILSKSGKNAITLIPKERLLVETDFPFSNNGNVIDTINDTYNYLYKTKGISEKDIFDNFRRLLKTT